MIQGQIARGGLEDLAPMKGESAAAARLTHSLFSLLKEEPESSAHSSLSQVEERPELYILRADANEGTSTQVIQRTSDSQHTSGAQRDGDSQRHHRAGGTQCDYVSQRASGTQRDSTTGSASTRLGDQARTCSHYPTK